MAKARQIVKRRKAVTNIRKITRTMQLIASARFQQALKRATATKPYTQKLTELVNDLAQSAGSVSHKLMLDNPEASRDALIVISSNRGLCGAYNGSVIRTAMHHLNTHKDRQTDLHAVGKKAITYFKFLGREMAERITSIDDRPRFEQVEPIANAMMANYEAGKLGAVYVAYMRFISAGRQVPEVIRLLPLRMDQAQQAAAAPARTVQYDFSPAPAELLAALLPQTVRVRLFQCFTDAAVSENISRMVAMKSATEAAEEMIKSLTRQFNRARQTQITLELLDIVGGAESLK